MNLQKIGDILRTERSKRKLRLEDVANENLSITTISNIERGLPNVIMAKYVMYAELLGLAEKLFGIVSESELEERRIKQRLNDIEEMLNTDPDKALSSLNELNKEKNILKMSTFAPIAHYLYGKCYLENRKNNKVPTKAKEHFSTAVKTIDTIPSLENSNYKAVILNELSIIAYLKSDYKQALNYVEDGLQAFVTDEGKPDRKYSLLLNKTIYLDELGHYEKSLRGLEKMQEEIQQLKQENYDLFRLIKVETLIQMYSMFADVLTQMNRPETALEYAEEGIDIARINQNYRRLFVLWTIVGTAYSKMENDEEAERYYVKALDIRKKAPTSQKFPFCYMNYGNLLIKLNRLPEAKEYIEEAIKISKSVNNQSYYTRSLLVSGKWHLQKKMYSEAINIYTEVEQLATQYEFRDELLGAIADLSTCFSKTNNQDMYHQYTSKLHQLFIQRRD
jgi:tetratricopeptide (TPR) repeat protein